MKTTHTNRDWSTEQGRFLSKIAAESHFHCVFEGLPGIYFFVKNRHGETIFCSSNLPHNHGLRNQHEILGKTDHDLTPGPLAEKYVADDAEIYRTGQPLPPQIEVCMDHVGLPDWYRTCKYPVKDRHGNVIGIMGTSQLATPEESPDLARGQLESARTMLTNNLSEFPGVPRLASDSKLSVRQFQRVFKKTFGTSPQMYWMKLRVRAACELIKEGQKTLLQISTELGFYDQSSFTRYFRKHTGKTPLAFARDQVA